VKAAVQAALSATPGGHRANFTLQSRVFHSLPVSDAKLATRVGYGHQHARAITRLGAVPFDAAHFFELGAGWDLCMPLVLRSLGAGRQTVVDLRPLARDELVRDMARRLDALARSGALPTELGVVDGSVDAFLRQHAIEYVAPGDARATGLPSASVDYITTTNTLEHIPRPDLARILRECRRVLKDDGVMSHRVDYQDHYSYFDGRLSPYNFLRYEPPRWRRYNPALHFQNRLRHSDYLVLYEQAGFEMAFEATVDGTPDDEAAIRALPLASCFAGYDMGDLAVRSAAVALRPARVGSARV
jgi:SAM-dependent methyltransferase